ncbi:type I site-specific restriction-modification system, R (restriction) subunit [Thauera sp. 28]|uniref:hypothetical protein n=1 Tax=Thauera sp. 28 TaxID=303682 RepID=UPI0002CDAC6B|nr:hypothetical protein [Thauera sp. 28]ENO93592.1 type I site-specific restriction-modification system, R (restriction) subunit [Thauera sp. 28]HAG74859.1 type I restriction endonuclease subunit R [Thauera sp.]HNS93958.1 type I restriction endonuclease subunit R [Thauera sp.]
MAGGKAQRGEQKRADYLPYFCRDFPLAVVEAKAAGLPAETGVQQAREYAEILGLKFASLRLSPIGIMMLRICSDCLPNALILPER